MKKTKIMSYEIVFYRADIACKPSPLVRYLVNRIRCTIYPMAGDVTGTMSTASAK